MSLIACTVSPIKRMLGLDIKQGGIIRKYKLLGYQLGSLF